MTLLTYAVWCLIYLSAAIARPTVDSTVIVRAPPGVPQGHVVNAIGQGVRRAIYTNNTREMKTRITLDRSWDDVTLLQIGDDQETEVDKGIAKGDASFSESVTIVCTTYYMKGVVTGDLSFPTNFTASLDLWEQRMENKVENLTEEAADYLEDYFGDVWSNILHDGLDASDFALPTFNGSLNLPTPALPEAQLHICFDGLELYLMLDTVLTLGSTYTQNLYTSETPVGFGIGEDTRVGFTLTVDLILDVAGEIDISSGVHIKLNDGLGLDIALFGKDVSKINFNGGHFEFLPVTVESAGFVLTAALRVGVHAGINLATPFIDVPGMDISGGIEVAVFADVAQFVTNVTYQPDDTDCELAMVQAYQFNLGAVAGATVAVDSHTWGPVAETSVPVWYTEIGSACAISKTAMATAAPNITTPAAAAKRQAMSTTTTTTELTYTGIKCMSTGLVDCPASLQTSTKTTATKTLTTVVPSGANVVWPANRPATVTTTVAFGAKAVDIPVITGKPSSWVPPPPPSHTYLPLPDPGDVINSFDLAKKLEIGIGVGLGVSILVAIVAITYFGLQRSRNEYAVVPKHENVMMIAQPYSHDMQGATQFNTLSRSGIWVTEIQPSFGPGRMVER